MRRILITAALLYVCACKDEDANRHAPKSDAGTPHATDAGPTASALDKPGSLARPPSGLPAELRPSR